MIAPPSRVLRLVRTILTVWLTFILTQPVAVHACAMRNGTLRAAPEAVGGAGQHDMASMTGDMARAMNHDASSPGSHTNQACHCFGDCAATAPAALLAAGYSLVPAPGHILVAATTADRIERTSEQPTYFQPPATAPPIA